MSRIAMTRAGHYLAGKAEGERWAEADLRNHRAVHAESDRIRALASDTLSLRLTEAGARDAAFELGRARGYRLTVARFERGDLTWEMMG
jgi:hypothetical protein